MKTKEEITEFLLEELNELEVDFAEHSCENSPVQYSDCDIYCLLANTLTRVAAFLGIHVKSEEIDGKEIWSEHSSTL